MIRKTRSPAGEIAHATSRRSPPRPADFGLAVQQARMASGLSQRELADRLDIAQSAVSEIETGKATIYLRRLLEIAREIDLNLTAEWEDDDAPGR